MEPSWKEGVIIRLCRVVVLLPSDDAVVLLLRGGVAAPVGEDDAVQVDVLRGPAGAFIMREQPDVISTSAGVEIGVGGAHPVEGGLIHGGTLLHKGFTAQARQDMGR